MGKSSKDKSLKNPLIDTPSSLKLDQDRDKDAMDVDINSVNKKSTPTSSSKMEIFKTKFN